MLPRSSRTITLLSHTPVVEAVGFALANRQDSAKTGSRIILAGVDLMDQKPFLRKMANLSHHISLDKVALPDISWFMRIV
jgi:hypothetical protein